MTGVTELKNSSLQLILNKVIHEFDKNAEVFLRHFLIKKLERPLCNITKNKHAPNKDPKILLNKLNVNNLDKSPIKTTLPHVKRATL